MTYQEKIKLCDSLPFLKRMDLHYSAYCLKRQCYYIQPDSHFKIYFWENGWVTYYKMSHPRNLRLSFEEFFDELPLEIKENIIFHLHLFRGDK